MTPTDIKSKIDRIASVTGNKVSSICQKVLKNPEYYDRLNKRIADDEVKGKLFSDYLNSVSAKAEQEKSQETAQ